MQTFLATGAGATIYTVQVATGTDSAFQGAMDALQINGTIYDFDPFGVVEVPVS
ncbi:MAG: hypothetical protein ABJH68_06550 [Ilumatobacter sp.]|uniref:hypothetical protein n=1 Tax=Ilumatobacter sp. TaxID=1967498 RepID=UPI003299A437